MVIFFLFFLIVYFSIITLNKGNVGTNHLNNRILFVCNRKVIYYYYITLPSITMTITITFGSFQSITITGKSGYYILQLHITITPSLAPIVTLSILLFVRFIMSIVIIKVLCYMSKQLELLKLYLWQICGCYDIFINKNFEYSYVNHCSDSSKSNLVSH